MFLPHVRTVTLCQLLAAPTVAHWGRVPRCSPHAGRGSASCSPPSGRSAFPVGRKGRISVNMVPHNHCDAWLLKYQTSAWKRRASCSAGRHESSNVSGFRLSSCWKQIAPLGLFSSFPRSFTDSSLKSGRKLLLQEVFLCFFCLIWVLTLKIPVVLWLGSL